MLGCEHCMSRTDAGWRCCHRHCIGCGACEAARTGIIIDAASIELNVRQDLQIQLSCRRADK